MYFITGMQHEPLSFAFYDGRYTLDSLMYEIQKDNIDTVRDRMLGLSGNDYKPDGVAIIHDKDGIPEITRRLRGCEPVSYSSE